MELTINTHYLYSGTEVIYLGAFTGTESTLYSFQFLNGDIYGLTDLADITNI